MTKKTRVRPTAIRIKRRRGRTTAAAWMQDIMSSSGTDFAGISHVMTDRKK